jgi:hypothetical protein
VADDVLLWPVRTTEYMHFDVTADADPLADDVKVALPAHGSDPVDDDYEILTAEWVPGQTWSANANVVTCRALIPKNHLSRGEKYDPWIQVSDNPEIPEMRAGADPITGEGGTVVKGI